MNATFTCITASAAQKGSARLLLGAPSKSHYRRSTTTKAPRKRTFLASMQKRSVQSIAGAAVYEGPNSSSVRAAFAPTMCTRIAAIGSNEASVINLIDGGEW